MAKAGVWLIGAQGSLASTVVLGARAIARGLAAGGGLVTDLPELAGVPLDRKSRRVGEEGRSRWAPDH